MQKSTGPTRLNKDLSILIPSRNRAQELCETIKRIKSFPNIRNCPLIIYDDASTSSEKYKELSLNFQNIQIITGDQRCGQAKARNILMESTKTRIALFLDDDVRPAEIDAIEDAVSQLITSDDVAIIVPYIRVDYSHYADRRISKSPQVCGDVKTFTGAAFLADINIVLNLGGFREFFVYGVEEPELSMRILGNQYRIIADPGISFIHEHSPSARNEEEYYYLYSRNHFLMYGLNFPWILGVPYGIVKSIAWWMRRKKYFGSRLKGLLHGFKDLIVHRDQHRSLGWLPAFKHIFMKNSSPL